MGNYFLRLMRFPDTNTTYSNESTRSGKKRKFFEMDYDENTNSSSYLRNLFSNSKETNDTVDSLLDDYEDSDEEESDLNESNSIENIKSNRDKSKSKRALSKELTKPSKKRMKSTSSYIYKTLFINGENSDIKVKALNNEWNLHKVYLCQSPYFDSMFKGYKWKESNQSCIEIAIPDRNINLKSLNIAFGSFYSEEVNIVPIESINILACASLFSLDGLINQCAAVMIENINAESIFAFYDASLTYGLKSVKEKALDWLCLNLMYNENDSIRLGEININLFEQIITSENFMIIQVETDLYSLCKKWLYYQLNKNEEVKKSQKVINEYFKNYLKDNKEENRCFLEIDSFSIYESIFRKIRYQHIITDYLSIQLIYNERIVPHKWIQHFYFKNWMNIIYIDQDKFSHEFEIDHNEFENECLRFGRTLLDENSVTWRWVGFNYGIDLIVQHTNRTISLKRNTLHMHSPYKGLLSNKNVQRIYFLIKLVQLDSFGNDVWSKKTDIKCLDLNRNEEKLVLTIDSNAKYPLMLNLKILTYPLNLSNSLLQNHP